MRFSVCRLLLPATLALFTACSEQKKPQAEQAQPATSVPPTDTVASAPPAPIRPDTTYVHDVAAYLAGQRVSSQSKLQPLTAQPAWQTFAADANKSWLTYHATRTNKIETWAATELDSVRAASPTIFYPFSGPDLLNVVTMFPNSKTYVLLGLEPVGSVPHLSTLENTRLLSAVKEAQWSVLKFSFFRTNDMAVELTAGKASKRAAKAAADTAARNAPAAKSAQLDGTLPLLLLFAARTGHQVQAVRYVQLDKQGQLLDADSTVIQKPGLKAVPGVEMVMLNQAGTEQKVYYFSADISDWKMSINNEAVLKYAQSLGELTTYVKSATYLMHKLYFSKVRNLILEHSNYVLQDDSGIALKYFKPTDWQLTYYGAYKRPINLFATYYQPAMTVAYTDTVNRPRPLPFGTGYNWRQNDSNLLLARRQKPL